MKRLLIGIFLIAGLGCGPYKPTSSETPLQETEKVLLLDHGLTYRIHVVKEASTRLAGGQFEVKMEIENKWNDDVWVDIQTIFRGTDGFEIEKTDWEPFLLHRRTVTLFQRNSLNTAAADYRILIRNVRN